MVPTCLAFILCDAVRRAGRAGDPSVVRAFRSFDIPFFPATTQPFAVWIQLSDGNGPTVMKLVIEYVPPGSLEAEEVLVIEFTKWFHDPNEIVEHDANFNTGIVLERSGRYRLRLTADGIDVAHRYFVAQLAPGEATP